VHFLQNQIQVDELKCASIAAIQREIADCIGRTEDMNMGLQVINGDISDEDMDRMKNGAAAAANMLKALSHEGRLMILCNLVSGEKSVSQLEKLLSARQAAVSQQLARLRLEGLVTPRRDGKTIYYSLTDDRPKQILEVIYDLFCSNDGARAT